MPKLFGKEIPTIALVGMAVVAIYLVSSAFSSDAPVVVKKKTNAVTKKASADVEYTPQDYKATFASLTTSPPDAFRPLISKGILSGSLANPSIDNFTYSGMAELNNEKNGLLENATTGEGDFVKPGDRWHQQWLVVSVTAEEIVLKNDFADAATTLKAGAAAEKLIAAAPGATGVPGNVPFDPTMVGQIGGQDMSMQADPNGQQQAGRGGQGGRRRGGGGRGGGGRGAGGGGRGGGGNGGFNVAPGGFNNGN